MTITLHIAPIATFVGQNPWPTVAVLFLLGIVAPGVWSRRRSRRHAALMVIRAIGDIVTMVAAALRGAGRP